jgi:hypothetical protein
LSLLLPFLVILLALTQSLHARQVLAVLEIIPTAEAMGILEAQHITNELRKQATLTLPQDAYTVLTRDNLISLIPQDEEEADRLLESGVIEIGKAIGAGYVTQGYINFFDKFLSLSVELYETESGRLVGSVVLEATNAMELLKLVRENSPTLFAKIDKPVPAKIPEPTHEPAPIAPPAPSSSGSFWTAKKVLRVMAFAFSAASVGVGIWQNGKMKSNIEKAGDLHSGALQTMEEHGDGFEYKEAYSSFESKIDDAKFNEKLRNSFYIGAGVFGVAGMVTFFF